MGDWWLGLFLVSASLLQARSELPSAAVDTSIIPNISQSVEPLQIFKVPQRTCPENHLWLKGKCRRTFTNTLNESDQQ